MRHHVSAHAVWVMITSILLLAADAPSHRAGAAVPNIRVPRETLAIAFSPDGKQLLLAVTENAYIYDAETGKELHSFDWGMIAGAAAFSPDRKQVLVGSGSDLWLYDMARGEKIREFKGHTGTIFSVAFSPGGKRALSGGQDTNTRLWDTATGREIRVFDGGGEWEDRVDIVEFSPDANELLIGGKALSVRDTTSGKELQRFEPARNGRYASFSPDGKQLVVGGYDDKARIWETSNWNLVRETQEGTSWITFTPDGKRLWVMVRRVPQILDAKSGKLIHQFEGVSMGVGPIAFSPDGKTVARADGVRDVNTLKLIWQVPGFRGF